MQNFPRRVARKIRAVLSSPKLYQITFAQNGEDMIVRALFENLGITRFSYLDIGAYDPIHFSNTYLHYRAGCRGVCVEPDATRCSLIQQKRPGDVCVNAGIGVTSEVKDFYVMTHATLSTFSKEAAEGVASMEGHRIERVEQIQLLNFDQIVRDNFAETPDFVSLDIEGGELDILRSIDFQAHRPKVWCIETINYARLEEQGKRNDILKFMLKQGYVIYADTWINTIFVDKALWPAQETLADLR